MLSLKVYDLRANVKYRKPLARRDIQADYPMEYEFVDASY